MESSSTTTNLTVKAVRRVKLDAPVPVYDATMPVHHNFVLGNGVVVHNTAKNARNPATTVFLLIKFFTFADV